MFSAERTKIPGIDVKAPNSATHVVELRADRIIFLGIDQPWVLDEQENDEFTLAYGRNGFSRFNTSRNNRMRAVTGDALNQLSETIHAADTVVLLKSLRSNVYGETDYAISRDGNWLIGAELARRMPIDDKLLDQADEWVGDVFTGDNGPHPGDIRRYIELAADHSERRQPQE